MGGAPAPVVSGPSQAELDQRQQQFSVTTQLQREAQAQQMALQERQYALQKEAQDRQLAAQAREAQIASNSSRRESLLERANSVAAKNEVSLMGTLQQEQAALTDNVKNTALEKQKKVDATSSTNRTNLISSLIRSRGMYG